MGNVSLNNSDRLYWLGRYAERVYTTLRLFAGSFDKMIDQELTSYRAFCERLEIPCIYTSGEDFVQRYCFDSSDPNSILSNLTRAYDNAIMLRDAIGSETISYIQLALYDVQKAEGDQAPMIRFQAVIDELLAFWGIVEDNVDSEEMRNLLKTGKRVERLDLFARMGYPKEDLRVAYDRLAFRLKKTELKYDPAAMEALDAAISAEKTDHRRIVSLTEALI